MRVLYVITEDWFFNSHFLDRAKFMAASGETVGIATRFSGHEEELRSHGFTLFPVSFSRRGLNPLTELITSLRIRKIVREFKPDIVVLAGFMRLLTMEFLAHFPQRVINVHPALPGELLGTNAIDRAFDEFVAGKRTHTGVMVHFVPDEGVDNGPVIDSAVVPIYPTDSLADLEQRMHASEHQLLITSLTQLTKEHTS